MSNGQDVNDINTPDYAEILSRRYDLRWTITGNSYGTLVVFLVDQDGNEVLDEQGRPIPDPRTKPSKAELDLLWTDVRDEIIAHNAAREKDLKLQTTYTIETQLIHIMEAIRDDDKTKINEMLTEWNSG